MNQGSKISLNEIKVQEWEKLFELGYYLVFAKGSARIIWRPSNEIVVIRYQRS